MAHNKEPNLAPKEEKASDHASALELDVAQLERLTAAGFKSLGRAPVPSQELAKAILKAALYPQSGAQEPHEEALTKRMYAP